MAKPGGEVAAEMVVPTTEAVPMTPREPRIGGKLTTQGELTIEGARTIEGLLTARGMEKPGLSLEAGCLPAEELPRRPTRCLAPCLPRNGAHYLPRHGAY